jgi:transposase InsO family protein
VYYYRSSNAAKGRRATTHTLKSRGECVCDSDVVETIKAELAIEFIDYGYLKMTHHLRQKYGYIINRKKVYRLMKTHRLLYKPLNRLPSNKTWVQHCVPVVEKPFSFWEFDIKYMYIAAEGRNALMLTVIDVKTRIVLGWILQYSIKKRDVIKLLAQIFTCCQLPESITVRTDNGSQFEAQLVRDYLKEMNVTQEFCHPATPEQNGHIESYHSIIERSICRRYEFKNLEEAKQTLQRFVTFYCTERIHSGIGYTSPYKYALALGVDSTYLCMHNGYSETYRSPDINANEGDTNPRLRQKTASEYEQK